MSAVTVLHGDMRTVLVRMKSLGAQFDAVATDPPYHLQGTVKRGAGAARAGFMGKQWDGGDIAFDPATWRLVFDVLKPGARLIAFSGDRTYHRMACAIEDAGFVIVRMNAWLYGSGFPKSHDFGASFDKALLGIDRDEDPKDWEASRSHFATYWDGWGSDQKPALEPLCVAMKPMDGTIAANVLKHGVGGVNVDGCRIHADDAQGGGVHGPAAEARRETRSDGRQLAAPGGRFCRLPRQRQGRPLSGERHA
jgi:site-specific DNA-methyltransferase (adenine-specific)